MMLLAENVLKRTRKEWLWGTWQADLPWSIPGPGLVVRNRNHSRSRTWFTRLNWIMCCRILRIMTRKWRNRFGSEPWIRSHSILCGQRWSWYKSVHHNWGVRFSMASMALQFGNPGQWCEWIEKTLLAASQDDLEAILPTHKVTTLQEFIDETKNTAVYSNFLDVKEMTPCPPFWATPLLQSTITWNHTMYLLFSQKAKKKTAPVVKIDDGAPRVIRVLIWSSQGWRLVTHGGCVAFLIKTAV